ncbi:MAG: DUF4160 domain-containing protein [Desulfovermiculus sp.]|nr:DUF4160 domain-containing protein [Desulfovermiculus sp.]
MKPFVYLEGRLLPRALGLVIEWAAQHKNELLENWELAKNNQAPRKFEPLKYGGVCHAERCSFRCL